MHTIQLDVHLDMFIGVKDGGMFEFMSGGGLSCVGYQSVPLLKALFSPRCEAYQMSMMFPSAVLNLSCLEVNPGPNTEHQRVWGRM